MRWSRLHGDMQGGRFYKEGAVRSVIDWVRALAKFLVG